MRTVSTRKGQVIMVDDEDYAFAASRTWCLNTNGYAVHNTLNKSTGGKCVSLLMHRALMGLPFGDQRVVDHINGNKLDNRRQNLRICEQRHNVRNQRRRSNNTSGFKGVSWHKQRGKWAASIHLDGKHTHIGLFDTPEEAHQAYVRHAEILHDEYANPGF